MTRHKRPKLDPYEDYVAINGGEFCGICGKAPSAKRKLDRDHDHKTGCARGLLCHRCNRVMQTFVTIEWLVKAIQYLVKAEQKAEEWESNGR